MRLLATYSILVGFALSPLFWVTIPPLVDYPIHLARMWILVHAADTPALAANYQPAWRLLPNLAMDLVVPGLMRIMPLEAAGRLFIALTLVLLVLGTAGLRRALQGRAGFWPLLSLLFLYNGALFWALLNYLFALGIVLLVFSLWLTTARWAPSLRLLVFSALACLIFVLHLFAFGLYGLLIGAYEIGQWWSGGRGRLRPHLIRAAQFLPALLLWLISLPNGGSSETVFGTVANKLYAAAAPGYFGTPALWLTVVIFAGCLVVLALALRARAASIVPAMRWPLAAVLVAAATMPACLDGSWLADLRLPVALPFLGLAALQVRTVERRYLVGFAAIALMLLGLRIGMVSASWRETDRSFVEFRRDLATLPLGARLLVARDPMPRGWRWPDAEAPSWIRPDYQSFDHMAMLAIIDRAAFVPGMITRWSSIEPTARHAGLFEAQGYSLTPAELAAGAQPTCLPAEWWCGWPAKFDYLLWIDFGRPAAALPADLQLWAQGSFFTLYRIVPGGAQGTVG